MNSSVTEIVVPESLRKIWILFQKEEQRMKSTIRQELEKELSNSVGKKADLVRFFEMFLKETGDKADDGLQENQKCGTWFNATLALFESHRVKKKPRPSRSQKSSVIPAASNSIKSINRQKSDEGEPVNNAVDKSKNSNRKLPRSTREKDFSQKSKPYKHKVTRTKENKFLCKICYRRFPRKAHLLTHSRIHSGEKPFECTFCERVFRRYDTLTNHIRTHTGERPHKCLWCGKGFNLWSYLKNHMAVHTKESHYKCELCPESFKHHSSLMSHRNKTHSTWDHTHSSIISTSVLPTYILILFCCTRQYR